MIDAAEITRLALVDDATLFAATGGIKTDGIVTTPCRIYHGQVPPEIDESWDQPEDVLPLVFIDADADTDVTAPMVEATLSISCWAASHQASMALAELVVEALESIDRKEIGTAAVYVSHYTPTGGAKNMIDVETLRRFTEINFETLMIE